MSVKGRNLRLVNALSFALPYDPKDLEFVGVEVKNMKNMENLTNDRLHTVSYTHLDVYKRQGTGR